MVDALEQIEPNMQIEVNVGRGGLNLEVPASGRAVSPEWKLGGFGIRFASLPAGDALEVSQASGPVYLKVITGEVDNGGGRAFPPAGAVTSTRMTDTVVRARRDALLCFVTDPVNNPSCISDMQQLTLRGALETHCRWQTFAEKFGAVTDVFNGLEAHMIPGFHLLDSAGAEIAYVHFWTTGKGVDVSTHNHGQDPSENAPAFAEVHLVLRNGTGGGAMYMCEAPGAEERVRTPIQAGEEHGPFFRYDAATGQPLLRDNGAVDYPWHGWQGGTGDGQGEREGEAYDLVAAFEISPDYARV